MFLIPIIHVYKNKSSTMTVIGLFCFMFFLLECKSDGTGNYEIVGGDTMKIEQVPFFAIYKPKRSVHGCGAFIITDQCVISAAHCHFLFEEAVTVIIVGTDKINNGQHYEIKAHYQHPNFDIATLDYDVIVLKLMEKFIFSVKVQPIKLADRNMVIEDAAEFMAMGFGLTDPKDQKSKSKQLLSVKVPYVNNEKCTEYYRKELTKQMMCAGRKGKSVCVGDSGGPLVYKGVVIGITSFANYDCSTRGWPAVYARVSTLRDFIDKVITENV